MRRGGFIIAVGLAGLFAAPAMADLPVLIALEQRNVYGLSDGLRTAGYPDSALSTVIGAMMSAMQSEAQPVIHASREVEPGIPFVNASSRVSGPCRQVEATVWMPDDSLPVLRISGRYCEQVNPGFSHIWHATAQRIAAMADGAPPPPGAPPRSAVVDR